MEYTRQDYVEGKCTHREYYAQFVNGSVKRIVGDRIGMSKILASTNDNFNNIPLSKWDRLHGSFVGAKSLSDTVCIAKEAAQQLKELAV